MLLCEFDRETGQTQVLSLVRILAQENSSNHSSHDIIFADLLCMFFLLVFFILSYFSYFIATDYCFNMTVPLSISSLSQYLAKAT